MRSPGGAFYFDRNTHGWELTGGRETGGPGLISGREISVGTSGGTAYPLELDTGAEVVWKPELDTGAEENARAGVEELALVIRDTFCRGGAVVLAGLVDTVDIDATAALCRDTARTGLCGVGGVAGVLALVVAAGAGAIVTGGVDTNGGVAGGVAVLAFAGLAPGFGARLGLVVIANDRSAVSLRGRPS